MLGVPVDSPTALLNLISLISFVLAVRQRPAESFVQNVASQTNT